MTSTNKTYLYVAGAIVVVIIAVWAIYANNRQNTATQNSTDQSASQTGASAPSSTPPASGSPAGRLSYGAAINAYPYRIQFLACHGTPGTLAVKKGSIVMLDNRDSVAHIIKADKQSFNIAAQDYALLDTSALSNTNITCDGGGAALLNVEK